MGLENIPNSPPVTRLSFLLRYHQRSGKEDALAMVEHTLKNIRLGGIYDQLDTAYTATQPMKNGWFLILKKCSMIRLF